MQENKSLRFLIGAACLAVGGLGAWLVLRFLLPWTLPFLIALGLSSLLERPVQLLMNRLHLCRTPAAALCTTLLAAMLMGGLLLAGWRLWYEFHLFLTRLPTLLSGLPSLGEKVEDWSYRFIIAAPPSLQPFLQDSLGELTARSTALGGELYSALVKGAATVLSALPDAALFLFTTGLATFFMSARRPALLSFFRRQAPPAWRPALRNGLLRLKSVLGCWLRAQGLLMLITCCELSVGFLALGVDYPLLLAALTALVDALPVFGTGTVLFPWALGELLAGRTTLALGLLLLYLLASAVRSLLEPRLVGARVGLPPLAALLAMYAGFRAFGVAGMILSPLAAMLLKEAHDCGILRLWKD